MPLLIERFNPDTETDFVPTGKLEPGSQISWVRTSLLDGTLELILARCLPDNSMTEIRHQILNIEFDMAVLQAAYSNFSNLPIVQILRPGESFEMTINTERTPIQGVGLRVTHR